MRRKEENDERKTAEHQRALALIVTGVISEKEALKAIEQADMPEKLNDVRVKFLGKKGELTAVLKGMKDVAPEDRPKVGQMVNETRAAIEAVLEENKEIKELYAYFDFPALPEELKAEDIVKETRHDKKMEHGKIKFILLDKVGEAAIYQDVTPEEMLTVLERV